MYIMLDKFKYEQANGIRSKKYWNVQLAHSLSGKNADVEFSSHNTFLE